MEAYDALFYGLVKFLDWQRLKVDARTRDAFINLRLFRFDQAG